MVKFEVGKMYDCGSYNGNENVFRIASRTETTVDLIAIYEARGEMKESSVGTWDIEVFDDVECVLIERGYFDDEDAEYIRADYPY
ncbi:MAG: hypothetical protein IKT67_03310 [Lachnospiraceae bacterium]|nr:hypothetical protein [Lachnospiraceae bacterium]